ETKQLDEKFVQNDLGAMKAELTQFEQSNKMKDERIRQLEESMRVLRTNFETVAKILSLNPTDREIMAGMARKIQKRSMM
ncbi:MAG: hypothetical protein NTZ16_13145, partial [Verrucomicrobia bacterium]|nr:hypothetical protein [Verrucomicrobiota bacterium]